MSRGKKNWNKTRAKTG